MQHLSRDSYFIHNISDTKGNIGYFSDQNFGGIPIKILEWFPGRVQDTNKDQKLIIIIEFCFLNQNSYKFLE